MASFEQLCATWSGGQAFVRLNIDQGSNDSNGWNVNYSVQSRDTHSSVSGTWDWSKSASIGGGGGSVGAVTGLRTITSGSVYVSCDVNGNGSISASAFMDVAFGSGTAAGSISLSRIPLAPSISSTVSSAITPVTATIAGAVSSNGHGTSTTITYFYRKQGVGSYANAGTGSSKNLTGLTPNTTYEWYITAVNNNGDSVTSSVQTFTTLSGVKMITVEGGAVDRVVKAVSPEGVITTRIVTKIT